VHSGVLFMPSPHLISCWKDKRSGMVEMPLGMTARILGINHVTTAHDHHKESTYVTSNMVKIKSQLWLLLST
jgi:hypothetical protein